MKFDLPDGYVLEKLDDMNWTIRKHAISKNGKPAILDSSYFPKLWMAYSDALDKFVRRSEDMDKIKETLDFMEKLKNEIIENVKI
jgi:hypothetical protein